jgi:transcriptional regulator of arginine metabolism
MSDYAKNRLDYVCAFWYFYAHIYASQIMPNASNEQAERREMLRELLVDGPAETQRSLVDALGAKGLTATQSSVSRDLREIGAIKTVLGYELPGAAESVDEMLRAAEFLRDVSAAGPNLTVIKTAIGAAQRVALALDRSGWPEMIGNIGGDDTVFVATNSAAAQKMLIAKIERVRV